MTSRNASDYREGGRADPLLEVALEAARLLGLAMKTLRGEPEPGFANKVDHTIRRIYEIDAARTHDS
ncbi:MAG TPA: hypothetical protein VJB57_02495 [Dehalococcoidia bacterium]|nr:hypothetical protein [Dehalococcoidia bacterium]